MDTEGGTQSAVEMVRAQFMRSHLRTSSHARRTQMLPTDPRRLELLEARMGNGGASMPSESLGGVETLPSAAAVPVSAVAIRAFSRENARSVHLCDIYAHMLLNAFSFARARFGCLAVWILIHSCTRMQLSAKRAPPTDYVRVRTMCARVVAMHVCVVCV